MSCSGREELLFDWRGGKVSPKRELVSSLLHTAFIVRSDLTDQRVRRDPFEVRVHDDHVSASETVSLLRHDLELAIQDSIDGFKPSVAEKVVVLHLILR